MKLSRVGSSVIGLGCFSLLSCSSQPADPGPLTLSGLKAVESPGNVLAYDVRWTTSKAADEALDVDCSGLTPWTISDSKAAKSHHVFLMGLVAGLSCKLTAKAVAGAETASKSITIQVDALPSYLPPITLSMPVSGPVAPGWTLLNLSLNHGTNEQTGVPYTVALVDNQARYRWYYQYPTAFAGSDSPVTQYQDGVVVGGRDVPLSYVTWQGKIVWSGPEGYHEVRRAETPGEFYYLTEQSCPPMTYPSGVIAEYDPAKRADVWSWKLCDHYTPPEDTLDWAHLNTVSLFPDEKSLLCSSRNQNSIFKIDRATGKLLWVMGYHGEVADGFHGDFTIADADRFLQQHDTTVLPNGHILMFDNGQAGVREYSRALELAYTYDPSGQSEAHVVWEYRHSPDIFADIWGSTQRFDNGDTLVDFGQRDPGKQSTIVEVTSDSKPLWEIETPEYWGVYRAERVVDPPQGFFVH